MKGNRNISVTCSFSTTFNTRLIVNPELFVMITVPPFSRTGRAISYGTYMIEGACRHSDFFSCKPPLHDLNSTKPKGRIMCPKGTLRMTCCSRGIHEHNRIMEGYVCIKNIFLRTFSNSSLGKAQSNVSLPKVM